MFRTIIALIRFFAYLAARSNQMKRVKKLEKAGDIAARDKIVNTVVPEWARFVVSLSRGTIEVRGEENLPSDRAVVFIGNHQGNFDIPILLGFVKKPMAFISKIEVLKIPYLGGWMRQMQCVFLDRKNMRQSVEAMREAENTLKRGYSLAIFPEGTRSRGGPVADFKAGSFKIAYKAGAPIVPITIDGSWRLFEERGRIGSGGHVRVTIHPAIETAGLSREEQLTVPESVRSIVLGGFDVPPSRKID
jgi:1-acyl-sn-glycerol-3-phosphate acyltransferase